LPWQIKPFFGFVTLFPIWFGREFSRKRIRTKSQAGALAGYDATSLSRGGFLLASVVGMVIASIDSPLKSCLNAAL